MFGTLLFVIFMPFALVLLFNLVLFGIKAIAKSFSKKREAS